MYECRCDERLKGKDERSTRLTYTVLCGGLEDLKIEARLIDERFVSVIEFVIVTLTLALRNKRVLEETGFFFLSDL